MIRKILLDLEEFEQSEGLANKSGLFQIQFTGLEGVATPEKFCNIYFHPPEACKQYFQNLN